MSRIGERVQREESRGKVDPQGGGGGRRTKKFLRTSRSNGNSGGKPLGREDVKEGGSRQQCKHGVNRS